MFGRLLACRGRAHRPLDLDKLLFKDLLEYFKRLSSGYKTPVNQKGRRTPHPQ